MNRDILELGRTEAPSRWLKAAVLILVAGTVVALAVNAATTTICEDEANGFYLANKPMPELLQAMSGNIHEDPPLYDILLHSWIGLFHRNVLALRGLSIVFWCLMLPGLFLATRRLSDARTAWMAVGIACLLPSHWLFPATMRWYSLFSCLSIWNLYSFLGIYELAGRESPLVKPVRSWARVVLPYAATGAALWYTNYAAPALFFSHLVVSLIGSPNRRRVVAGLVAGWSLISILYLPWVPTFLSQTGISVRTFTPVRVALSLWVLTAGEFYTPLNRWLACSVVLAGLLLAVLALRNLKRCWIPSLIVGVVLMVMIASGVIWVKRVMFLVPLLAMTIALALQHGSAMPRWLANVRTATIALGLVLTISSFLQMVRREDWVTYRWLDPIETALHSVKQRDPEAIVLTNSNPALFYLGDERGKGAYKEPARPGFRFTGLYFPFANHLVPFYEPRLNTGRTAVYLHHFAYGGPLSGVYNDVVREMGKFGYRPEKSEAFLAMPAEYVKCHPLARSTPGDWTDSYRVVLLYFRKPDGEILPETALQTASIDDSHGAHPGAGTSLE